MTPSHEYSRHNVPSDRSRSVPARATSVTAPARRRTGTRGALWILAISLAVLALAGCDARDLGPDSGWSGATLSEDVVFVGSREDELLALDSASGNLIWSFPQDGQEEDIQGIYASPVVAGDVILVSGYNGILYAVDPETRQQVWQFETGDSIVGSPALLFETTEPVPTPTPSDGSPFTPTPTPSADPFSTATPAPSDADPSAQDAASPVLEAIIVGSSDGVLYALNAEGVEQWSFETGNKIWSMPVIYEDVAYFGSLDNNIYAVAVRNTGSSRAGEEVWRFETGGAVAATPLVLDGRVYVGSFDRNFYALDAYSGEEEWTTPFEAGNWFWSSAISDGTTIYTASLDGNLYALDADNGLEKWRFETEHPIISAPALVSTGVVVATDNGDAYLVRKSDGSEISDFSVRDHIRAPLTASGTIVYFSAMDSTVHAYDLQSGFWVKTWCFNTKESNRQCE